MISHSLQRMTPAARQHDERTVGRLRARTADSGGFTLPEILVVMLIVGILAAIAIPAFLSTTENAKEAQAKTLAHTAQVTAETIGAEDSGNYENVTLTELHRVEPVIVTSETVKAPKSEAFVSAAEHSAGTYSITVTASNGDTLTIAKGSGGALTRTCTSPKGSKSCTW